MSFLSLFPPLDGARSEFQRTLGSAGCEGRPQQSKAAMAAVDVVVAAAAATTAFSLATGRLIRVKHLLYKLSVWVSLTSVVTLANMLGGRRGVLLCMPNTLYRAVAAVSFTYVGLK